MQDSNRCSEQALGSALSIGSRSRGGQRAGGDHRPRAARAVRDRDALAWQWQCQNGLCVGRVLHLRRRQWCAAQSSLRRHSLSENRAQHAALSDSCHWTLRVCALHALHRRAMCLGCSAAAAAGPDDFAAWHRIAVQRITGAAAATAANVTTGAGCAGSTDGLRALRFAARFFSSHAVIARVAGVWGMERDALAQDFAALASCSAAIASNSSAGGQCTATQLPSVPQALHPPLHAQSLQAVAEAELAVAGAGIRR